MGKSVEDHSSFNLLSKANEILDYPISKLMLEGPEDELRLTQNTQPAILTYSIALFQKAKEILDKKGVTVDRVLGHSVGEYAALVAAGVLSFEDAVLAVHLRGKYMQEATPSGVGTMYAIMKVPQEMVIKACQEASQENSEVMPANFNEPNQIVISGELQACKRAVNWLEQNVEGRFRAIELKVSAPFHSSLMKPATDKLSQAFTRFTFSEPKVSYIANIDAKEYGAGTPVESIKENLLKQVCGSVLWTQSIEKLPSSTLCLEVGPGKVQMGLVRKINRDIKVISLDGEGAFLELEELLS